MPRHPTTVSARRAYSTSNVQTTCKAYAGTPARHPGLGHTQPATGGEIRESSGRCYPYPANAAGCSYGRDSPYVIQGFSAMGWGRSKLSGEGLVSLKEVYGRPPARLAH